MNSDMIINPFLNLLNIELSNLYNEYKYVYIICNRSDLPIDNEIYKYYISESNFNKIKENLIIVRTSIKILNNINHANKLILLPASIITDLNIFNYKLNDRNIGLLILNINYQNVSLYLSQYEEKNTLEDIFKFQNMNNYFKNTSILNYKRMTELLSFEDSNYWTYDYKCKINLSEYFNKRKFNLSNRTLKEIGCYLTDIYKTKDYIDPSKILSSGKFKYTVFNEKTITKDDINSLFDILDEKQQYLLFCNLIVSKRYCHLALNNIYLLRLMKNTISQFIELFRYLIGYAWLKFYFDESIKKSFISKNDDFIFDINTASELPSFPFMLSNPKLNPYMPILVDDDLLNPNENIAGVHYLEESSTNNICNLEEFRTRLNIFSTNNPNMNIFEFIDWEEDKIAISGSVMAACLQKSHPLLKLFNNINVFEEKLARFFNEYYALADIDIMFLSNDTFEYMQRVQKFYNQIVVNTCNLFPYAEPSHTKLVSDKIAYLFINDNTALKLFNNSRTTLAEVKKSINENEVKKLFEPIFLLELEKFKKNILDTNQKDIDTLLILYPDYFDFENITWKVRFNSKSDSNNNIVINYKYKITSPHINHQLELFSVKYTDFFSTVQSFHLPCVRSYYDGNNIYLTPSCISAHLTYMNIDYKYFAGSRDPIDIINKYRMRGFGTWLNNDEKTILLKYSKNNLFWNNLYNIDFDNDFIKINGYLNMNHKLFHPRLHNMEYFYDAFPIDFSDSYTSQKEIKKIESNNDFFIALSNKYRVYMNFLNNMQTVDINGSITQLDKWVFEACYTINKNNTNKNNKLQNIKSSKIKNANHYDISGGYNLQYKKNNINKIKSNYTPNIDSSNTHNNSVDISNNIISSNIDDIIKIDEW